MKPPGVLFAALSIVTLVSSTVPSGADEKDKNKAKAKPPARSYSDEDLKKYKETPTEGGTGSQAASSGEPSTANEPTSSEGSNQEGFGKRSRRRRSTPEAAKVDVESPTNRELTNPEEAMWKVRAAEARRPIEEAQSRIQGIEAEMAELRDKLNPMSTKYVLGGNSTAGPGAIYEVEEQLRALEAQLVEARAAAIEAEQSWQRFVEEARAAGASPAWLNP